MKNVLYLAFGFFCCISFAIAQPSDYSIRQSFVIALQQGKNTIKDLSQGSSIFVPITNSTHDAMKLIDFDGSCKTLINDDVKFFRANDDYITLQVRRRYPTNDLDVLSNSDEMVCYLNGWLMFAWGSHVHKDSLGGEKGKHKIGERCKNNNQKYYMGKADISNQIDNALHEMLDAYNLEWLGDNDKSYSIMKNNGSSVTVNGNDLFNFPRQNSSSNYIHYIGTYKPGINGPQDTGLAKVAYSYIEFKNYYTDFRLDVQSNGFPDGESKKILSSIEISAHTAKYANDCSITGTGYNLGTGKPIPEMYAGMDMVITYIDYNQTPPQELTATCAFDFQDISDIDNANDTLWKYFSSADPSVWYNGDYPLMDKWARFDIDKYGYIKFYIYGTQCSLNDSFRVMRVRNRETPAEYCEVTLPKEGSFSVDNMTGEIIYTDNNNVIYSIPCLEFCKKISGYRTVDGVIASSAVRLSDVWDKENKSFRTTRVLDTWYAENRSNNVYETGARGNWRPEATFAYKTQIKQGNGIDERIYKDAGVYLNDQGEITDGFRIYDWRNPSANDATKWLQLNQVTITSPYGEPLEEKDILNIYSAAKFSHKNTVPKMVARNASYTSIEFQSFEDWSIAQTTPAHSGRLSLKLEGNIENNPILASILPDNQNPPSAPNFLISVWVKQTYENSTEDIPISSNIAQAQFKKIAKTGEWTLYEAEAMIQSASQNSKVDIKLKSNLSGDDVWIDDFKIQPLESEATCYSYDPVTLKLAAQFDDRHFGVFYQYNGEGKLIRKLRETERGLKTVTETQYHTPLPYYRDGSVVPMAFSGANQPSFGIQSSSKDILNIPNGPTNRVKPPSGEIGADVDILDLEIGSQGYDLSMFGSQKLPDWDSFTRWFSDSLSGGDLLNGVDLSLLDSLQFPSLPAVEQFQIIQEIKETDSVLTETIQQADNQTSDTARQVLMLRAAELRKHRQELIEQRLGISEQEFRDFIERNRDKEDEETGVGASTEQESGHKGEK